MGQQIIVAGTRSFSDVIEDWAIFKLDSAGNVYPHGHRKPIHGYFLQDITGIALDDSGCVYVCSRNRASPNSSGYDDVEPPGFIGTQYYVEYPQWTVRKYDPYGFVMWQANHGAACHDLAIDSSGNVYTVGDAVNASGEVWVSGSRTGFYTTRKYNSSGVLQWSVDHGYSSSEIGLCITVDSSGNVYTGGAYYQLETYGAINKYNSSGVFQWKIDLSAFHQEFANDLAVDSSGNLYVAGYTDNGYYTLLKYNSSGVFQNGVQPGGTVQFGGAVAIDSDGNIIYCKSYNNGTESYIYKYDSSLALLASQNPLDVTGNTQVNNLSIYGNSVAYITSIVSIIAVDLSGTFGEELWIYVPKDDDNSSLNVFCVASGIVETPPLPILLSWGDITWVGDFYSKIPALSVPFSPGVPYTLREYVGPPSPEIYRLYLTGSPTIELPLSQFTLRQTSNGLGMDVVCPGIDLDTLDAIEARSSGDLIIRRGFRFFSGEEQLEELASAVLETLRYDAGGFSASVSLSAQRELAVTQTQTRLITGISYRSHIDNKQRVRSAIDTYLRVGDTADLGNGETWTVASITITVSITQAFMEISDL